MRTSLILLFALCGWLPSAQADLCDAQFQRLTQRQLYLALQDGSKLHAAVAGTPKKTKIIFIHGSPGSSSDFAKLMESPELRDRAYLVAVDRPGFGASTAEGASLSKQAEALSNLLNADDGTQQVILVGHSYGAAVVAQMAMKKDPRIRSVVMLGAIVDPKLTKKRWYQTPAEWAEKLLPRELKNANTETLALKTELEQLPWQDLQTRVTAVTGLADKNVAPQNADFLEAQVKQATILRVPGLGHAVVKENSSLVEKLLLQELENLAKAP